jgi:aspartate/glutamate/glutamine transport system substrate-binding protein
MLGSVSFVLAAAIALLASSAPTKLDEIRARGVLRVSVKTAGPSAPAAHKDPAHFQKRNFELAIAERIARDILGAKARSDYRTLPREKRLVALAAGEVDLVISMIAVTEERSKQVDFSEPYYVGGLALITAKDSKLAGIAELEGKRVAWAHQNNNNPLPQIEAAWKSRSMRVELVKFGNFKQAVEALRAEKADALVSWNPNIEIFLQSESTAFRRVGALLTEEHYAIAVKKGDADLLQRVNATLKEMKTSGELAKLAAASALAFPDAK